MPRKPRSTYILTIEGGHGAERQDVADRIFGLLADTKTLWEDHPRVEVYMNEISDWELRHGIHE